MHEISRCLRHAVVAMPLLLATPALAGGCIDCSHRGGKGGPIVYERVAVADPYSPYNGRRASGSPRGIGGSPPAEPHMAPVPVTRAYAPYTAAGMQHLDGGAAGQVSHSGGHGSPPSGR